MLYNYILKQDFKIIHSPSKSKRFLLNAVVDTNNVIFCCFMLMMSFWSVSICFLRSSCWISLVLNQLSLSFVVNLLVLSFHRSNVEVNRWPNDFFNLKFSRNLAHWCPTSRNHQFLSQEQPFGTLLIEFFNFLKWYLSFKQVIFKV